MCIKPMQELRPEDIKLMSPAGIAYYNKIKDQRDQDIMNEQIENIKDVQNG